MKLALCCLWVSFFLSGNVQGTQHVKVNGFPANRMTNERYYKVSSKYTTNYNYFDGEELHLVCKKTNNTLHGTVGWSGDLLEDYVINKNEMRSVSDESKLLLKLFPQHTGKKIICDYNKNPSFIITFAYNSSLKNTNAIKIIGLNQSTDFLKLDQSGIFIYYFRNNDNFTTEDLQCEKINATDLGTTIWTGDAIELYSNSKISENFRPKLNVSYNWKSATCHYINGIRNQSITIKFMYQGVTMYSKWPVKVDGFPHQLEFKNHVAFDYWDSFNFDVDKELNLTCNVENSYSAVGSYVKWKFDASLIESASKNDTLIRLRLGKQHDDMILTCSYFYDYPDKRIPVLLKNYNIQFKLISRTSKTNSVPVSTTQVSTSASTLTPVIKKDPITEVYQQSKVIKDSDDPHVDEKIWIYYVVAGVASVLIVIIITVFYRRHKQAKKIESSYVNNVWYENQDRSQRRQFPANLAQNYHLHEDTLRPNIIYEITPYAVSGFRPDGAYATQENELYNYYTKKDFLNQPKPEHIYAEILPNGYENDGFNNNDNGPVTSTEMGKDTKYSSVHKSEIKGYVNI